MKLILPKKTGHNKGERLWESNHAITIIGANGSGKTRFTDKLMSSLEPQNVFRISALKAMFVNEKTDPLPSSIDGQYSNIISKAHFLRDNAVTQFEKMVSIFIYEEMLNLMKYKTATAGKPKASPLKSTRLDKLIEKWQEIFPDNKVLLKQGRLLFSRQQNDDEYSTRRLSSGEKAVFYYLGAAILAPANAIVFVDNPAQFLHPSIQRIVWDSVEKIRSDCSFIYTTHDTEFSSDRSENTIIWVKSYNSDDISWDYTILPPRTSLLDDIYISILGERKPVLFIEGDAIHSIDSKLYPLIFKRFAIKPLGSCDKVIESVRSFNDLQSLQNLDAYGIVDRDRRTDDEVLSLRKRKILVPDVAEIENILMLEDVMTAVCLHNEVKSPIEAVAKVKNNILELFKVNLEAQAIEHTRHRIKRTTQMIIDLKADSIEKIEEHLNSLTDKIKPKDIHANYVADFINYYNTKNYDAILKVFNHKEMISQSNVAIITGSYKPNNGNPRKSYINSVIDILKEKTDKDKGNALMIRNAIERCFRLNTSTITEKQKT